MSLSNERKDFFEMASNIDSGPFYMLIDSHAHLEMKDFNKDRAQVIERALKAGITHIITIGTDLPSSVKALHLANEYDFIFSSIGYHPHNAKNLDPGALKELSGMAGESKIVAWGEIGLDYYRNLSPSEKQIEAFEQQLDLAIHFNLPVIIHSREADKELLEILKKRGDNKYRGVIHCFSGNYDLAMTFVQMGFYISIPGIVTYKNAFKVQDVASRLPLDRMLLETDAPFLTPVPKRGKRNEPLFVTYTAKEIANLRKTDFEEVARRTSENTKRLFRLPDSP
jgi:TatD DNase family protein